MPETTQSRPTLPTRRSSCGYLLPHPSLLATTIPSALQAQRQYGPVKGGDSPETVFYALVGQRTALRHLCDSLQLERQPASPAENEARAALHELNFAYADSDQVKTTRILEKLHAALEGLLSHVQNEDRASGDGR